MIARLTAFAAAATLIAGCTPPPAQPAASTTPAPTAPAPVTLATFASFTQADLATAIAMARAATPPDTEAAACFVYVSANLATLEGQVSGATAPAGVFSAFEAANMALGTADTAMSSTAKTAAETACAPLAAHVVNEGTSLATEVAALLAQVGIHVAVP